MNEETNERNLSNEIEDKKESKSFLTKKDILGIAIAIALTVLFRMFVIDTAIVEGNSMETTIHDGDRVIYSKLQDQPISGQVAIVDAGEHVLIKRVIATEGDTIEIKEGAVYLDDILLEEPYLAEVPNKEDYPRTTLEKGEFFAMGDNRNHSSDSRIYGVFSVDNNFKGHVLYRFRFFSAFEKL